MHQALVACEGSEGKRGGLTQGTENWAADTASVEGERVVRPHPAAHSEYFS